MIRDPIYEYLRAPAALAAIVVLIVLAAAIDSCGDVAEAQIPARLAAGGAAAVGTDAPEIVTPPPTTDLDAVAQCLVAEDEIGRDWPAIIGVLDLRARRLGVSRAAMARAYCAVLRTRYPTSRQRWIRALPSVVPSPRIGRVWDRAVVAAEATNRPPCRADHWGAPTGDDYARAVRRGWRRVQCGARLRNAFWGL